MVVRTRIQHVKEVERFSLAIGPFDAIKIYFMVKVYH